MPALNNVGSLAAAVAVGVALGTCYFGGLWWTVRRLPHVRHPLRLYFGSLVARLAVVVAVFCGLLSICDWRPLVVSLLAFFTVRTLWIRWLGHAAALDSPFQEAV